MMTQAVWWLQVVGLASNLVAAGMLAANQRPAPDHIPGNIIPLRNPKRWRWGFLGLVVGFLVQFAALAVVPPSAHARQAELRVMAADVIEGQRFLLRDARGTMRAELHARHPSVGAVLDLYDENARHTAELSETGLVFWGRSGTPYAVLEIVADTARLALKTRPSGETGAFTTRAELTLPIQGEPRITLHSGDGKVAWHV
jgi:hypothetical protein